MQQPEIHIPPRKPPRRGAYPWWRSVVALLCVLPSAWGMLGSILLSAMALERLGHGADGLLCALLGVMALFAWVAFFWMLLGWLSDSSVDSFWYIYGTFCGAIVVGLANVFALLVLPVILLACHLVRFHWARDQRSRGSTG